MRNLRLRFDGVGWVVASLVAPPLALAITFCSAAVTSGESVPTLLSGVPMALGVATLISIWGWPIAAVFGFVGAEISERLFGSNRGWMLWALAGLMTAGAYVGLGIAFRRVFGVLLFAPWTVMLNHGDGSEVGGSPGAGLVLGALLVSGLGAGLVYRAISRSPRIRSLADDPLGADKRS